MIPKTKILTTMRKLLPYCIDECNEVNSTRLAEDTCCALNDYDGDNIPQIYFDLAAELSINYENKK